MCEFEVAQILSSRASKRIVSAVQIKALYSITGPCLPDPAPCEPALIVLTTPATRPVITPRQQLTPSRCSKASVEVPASIKVIIGAAGPLLL